MFSRVALCALLFVLSVSASSNDRDDATGKGKVVEMTTRTRDSVKEWRKFTAVYHYLGGENELFRKSFEQQSKSGKFKDVTFAALDVVKHVKVSTEHRVGDFEEWPTIKIFSGAESKVTWNPFSNVPGNVTNDEFVEKYQSRIAKDFETKLESVAGNVPVLKTVKEVEAFLADNDKAFLGLFDRAKGEAFTNFETLFRAVTKGSDENKDVKFALSTNNKVLKKFTSNFKRRLPMLQLKSPLQKTNKGVIRYKKRAFGMHNLENFLYSNMQSPVTLLSGLMSDAKGTSPAERAEARDWKLIPQSTEKSNIIVFFPTEAEAKEAAEDFTKFAEGKRLVLDFFFGSLKAPEGVPETLFQQTLDSIGVDSSVKEVQAFALAQEEFGDPTREQTRVNLHRYREIIAPFSAGGLEDFVTDFIEGDKLEPFRRPTRGTASLSSDISSSDWDSKVIENADSADLVFFHQFGECFKQGCGGDDEFAKFKKLSEIMGMYANFRTFTFDGGAGDVPSGRREEKKDLIDSYNALGAYLFMPSPGNTKKSRQGVQVSGGQNGAMGEPESLANQMEEYVGLVVNSTKWLATEPAKDIPEECNSFWVPECFSSRCCLPDLEAGAGHAVTKVCRDRGCNARVMTKCAGVPLAKKSKCTPDAARKHFHG